MSKREELIREYCRQVNESLHFIQKYMEGIVPAGRCSEELYWETKKISEELQALFDSRDLDITSMEEGVLDNASYFGRIFARCGGLSDAVAEGLKEQGIDFLLKPCSCDGIEQCKIALLQKSKGKLDANFIEGMACVGGCIGGAGCLTHGEKNKAEVDKYGKQALEKTISDAVSMLK